MFVFLTVKHPYIFYLRQLPGKTFFGVPLCLNKTNIMQFLGIKLIVLHLLQITGVYLEIIVVPTSDYYMEMN